MDSLLAMSYLQESVKKKKTIYTISRSVKISAESGRSRNVVRA